MQRLYVGGLGHAVTQKDLRDRFGKFGAVEDVELRIRKDAEGQELLLLLLFVVILIQLIWVWGFL